MACWTVVLRNSANSGLRFCLTFSETPSHAARPTTGGIHEPEGSLRSRAQRRAAAKRLRRHGAQRAHQFGTVGGENARCACGANAAGNIGEPSAQYSRAPELSGKIRRFSDEWSGALGFGTSCEHPGEYFAHPAARPGFGDHIIKTVLAKTGHDRRIGIAAGHDEFRARIQFSQG